MTIQCTECTAYTRNYLLLHILWVNLFTNLKTVDSHDIKCNEQVDRLETIQCCWKKEYPTAARGEWIEWISDLVSYSQIPISQVNGQLFEIHFSRAAVAHRLYRNQEKAPVYAFTWQLAPPGPNGAAQIFQPFVLILANNLFFSILETSVI